MAQNPSMLFSKAWLEAADIYGVSFLSVFCCVVVLKENQADNCQVVSSHSFFGGGGVPQNNTPPYWGLKCMQHVQAPILDRCRRYRRLSHSAARGPATSPNRFLINLFLVPMIVLDVGIERPVLNSLQKTNKHIFS